MVNPTNWIECCGSKHGTEGTRFFYSAGNRSRFANILYSGEPVGHLLVIQKKQTVYSYLISGYLIDDPYVWMELFNKRIQSL